MSRLRIGVVGVGEAAQIMHLPSLKRLSDDFIVTALADVSANVVQEVGERHNVAHRFTDWHDVVTHGDVDVVLVSCSNAYHAEVGLAAMAAGKHVMIEKPMCLNRREAGELVTAAVQTGLVLQVGYMRRYAEAFIRACRLVRGMSEIRLACVRNVLGVNELIGVQAADVVRPDDLTPAQARRPEEDQQRLLAEELGPAATAEDRHTLFFLLSLNTHDFSAMRELLGRPRSVLYAARHDGGVSPYLTAAFAYDGFVCHFEAGFDQLPRVEQSLRVYGNDQVISVAYDTAFVRNLPVRLTVTEALGETGTSERTEIPCWEDPFVSEWRAFHASVTAGAPVKASAADAALDIDLCRDVAAAIVTSR